MIAGTRASDTEQGPLAVIDLFEIGVVGDILDPLLRRDHLVIAPHDCDGTKFETLREMHRADRDLAGCDLDLVAEFDRLNTGLFDSTSRSAKLAV
jgi:hypothetical protein